MGPNSCTPNLQLELGPSCHVCSWLFKFDVYKPKFGLELEGQSKAGGTKAPPFEAHVNLQILLPWPTKVRRLSPMSSITYVWPCQLESTSWAILGRMLMQFKLHVLCLEVISRLTT